MADEADKVIEGVVQQLQARYQIKQDMTDWFLALGLVRQPRTGPFTNSRTLWEAYNRHREEVFLAALRQINEDVWKQASAGRQERKGWAERVHVQREDFTMQLGEWLYGVKGWHTATGLRKVKGYYNFTSPFFPALNAPFADSSVQEDSSSTEAPRDPQPINVKEAPRDPQPINAKEAPRGPQPINVKEPAGNVGQKDDDGMRLRLYQPRSAAGRAGKKHQKSTVMTPRYMNEFVAQLSCAADLLDLKLYPDAGEITESMSMFNAYRKHLSSFIARQDPTAALVSVGDGATPRTAAMFAYRTAWQCHSVDPILPQPGSEPYTRFTAVDRLSVHPQMIEQFSIKADKVLVVLVHAHVDLCTVLRSIDSEHVSIVAMPCCNFYNKLLLPGMDPDLTYEDEGVFSPDRTIRVWKKVNARDYSQHHARLLMCPT